MHLPALHLPYQSLVVIPLVGLVAGWIAAKFMTKHGMGIVGDIVVGVIGAYAGNWLAPRLGVHFGLRLKFDEVGAPTRVESKKESARCREPFILL